MTSIDTYHNLSGNWGVTSAPQVKWLTVAVLENYASPEALANGPISNETVTGRSIPGRSR